ncbi:MAG: aminodeoxychorismate synthase component I [Calditrichia bacterium]
MDQKIKQLIRQIRIEKIQYNKDEDAFSGQTPVFHIPSWRLTGEEIWEYFFSSFAFLITLEEASFYMIDSSKKLPLDLSLSQILKLLTNDLSDSIPLFIFVSYEYQHHIERLQINEDFYQQPDLIIAVPGKGKIVNHSNQTAFSVDFTGENDISSIREYSQKNVGSSSSLTFNISKDNYLEKIKRIKKLITMGEVYQINFTLRLSADLSCSPYEFFRKLYTINQAPYAFYAEFPWNFQLISNSPERFISYDKGKYLTEPIKGTIPRGDTPEEDAQLKHTLMSSEKDLAELSMIVDLLRNDLNKICKPGSVVVSDHARLETYQNVHHLVSTIEGMDANATIHFPEMLEAVFPGGSITGCPKIAAMNYINELEPHNRGFYTGAFFVYYPRKELMDSSILIRTAQVMNNKIHFQVGGGIVIDSDPESEYNECMAKAASFMKAIREV